MNLPFVLQAYRTLSLGCLAVALLMYCSISYGNEAERNNASTFPGVKEQAQMIDRKAGASLTSNPVTPSFVASHSGAINGETSRPDSSTFIPGETITLSFWGTGLNPEDTRQTITVTVYDEHDKVRSAERFKIKADTSGSWKIDAPAPNQGIGFYKVIATTTAGGQLSRLGTRGAGYLTYAVVPDPAQRVLVDETKARFGMQGGLNSKLCDVFPYLGIRWILDSGYRWRDNEPDRAGQYAGSPPAEQYSYKGKPWKMYTLPSLYVNTPDWAVLPNSMPAGQPLGMLTPSGETAWKAFAAKAVNAYSAHNPDRKEHLFQLTWEPQPGARWKGSAADLVRVYAAAYDAIHAADPKAKVIGPTLFPDAGENTSWLKSLLNAGLAQYLDGFSVHPYAQDPVSLAALAGNLRTQKSLVDKAKKRELPRFGTEQGWNTQGNPANDMTQARGLLRSEIIMLGEGYRFNFTFYIADFFGEPGYGYYYNLNPAIEFGTDKISPKPIVPAYAFYTWLLEGATSEGAIENLGRAASGYRFVSHSGQRIMALFSYANTSKHSVAVPAAQADVYDWMGRKSRIKITDGRLAVTLSPEPLYIVY